MDIKKSTYKNLAKLLKAFEKKVCSHWIGPILLSRPLLACAPGPDAWCSSRHWGTCLISAFSLCSIKAMMLVYPIRCVTSFIASLLQSPTLPAFSQGLFGTKQVHKQDSLVSINRQHDLYTTPLSSWLPTNQARLCKSHIKNDFRRVCQPTQPITCANHSNYDHINM